MYVANVGDSRALLCKTDSNQVLRVIQLSIDHDLRNEDELLRLSQVGLDVKSIRHGNTKKKKIQKYMHHENKMYLNEILKYLILKYMKF